MAKIDKLKARVTEMPKDFTWKELRRLLGSLGYKEKQAGATSGSRVRFVHEKFKPILLHKPHPQLVIKPYLLRFLVDKLQQRGQL